MRNQVGRLSGENLEALAGGVFDGSAPRDTLIDTALAKATRYAELPRAAFATIKRQLREPTLSAIVTARDEAASRGASTGSRRRPWAPPNARTSPEFWFFFTSPEASELDSWTRPAGDERTEASAAA